MRSGNCGAHRKFEAYRNLQWSRDRTYRFFPGRAGDHFGNQGRRAHAGEVEADGDVLKFTAICGGSNVEGVGRYRWTLDGNALHLDLMGRDECSGRSAILEDATYKRSG